MKKSEEFASEHKPEDYQVECFVYFTDNELSKYDFRTKSLETGLDLLRAICERPAHKGQRAEMSITIGILNWSAQGSTPLGITEMMQEAENILNWKIL